MINHSKPSYCALYQALCLSTALGFSSEAALASTSATAPAPTVTFNTPGTVPPGCNPDILSWMVDGAATVGNGGLTGVGSIGTTLSNNPTANSANVSNNGQTVTYTAADGTTYTQNGGSLAWRNNNPGNIVYGSFAISQGAIGQNGGFAVFPDATTGQTALTNLLGGSVYQPLSINAAIATYAPAFENNTAAYQTFVTQTLGVSGTTTLSSLTPTQMSQLQSAIIKQEGYIPGTTTQL